VAAYARLAEKVAFAPEKMRKQSIFDSANMFCDAYCFEAGQAQTPHAHGGSDKVYYVVEGQAEIQIGDAVRQLGAGELAHAAPGVAHGVRNTGSGRLTLLVFMAPKP
jgi:quercetin dioxygenase-like cupin family protein